MSPAYRVAFACHPAVRWSPLKTSRFALKLRKCTGYWARTVRVKRPHYACYSACCVQRQDAATIQGFSSVDQPDEVKRRVGLVSTSAGLYPQLSVREMLLFADLYGVEPDRGNRESIARRPDRAANLCRVGVSLCPPDRSSAPSTSLALIHRPPVLLLDEPTLGLDVLGGQVGGVRSGRLRAERQSSHSDDAPS
jgi:hypothetical protein